MKDDSFSSSSPTLSMEDYLNYQQEPEFPGVIIGDYYDHDTSSGSAYSMEEYLYEDLVSQLDEAMHDEVLIEPERGPVMAYGEGFLELCEGDLSKAEEMMEYMLAEAAKDLEPEVDLNRFAESEPDDDFEDLFPNPIADAAGNLDANDQFADKCRSETSVDPKETDESWNELEEVDNDLDAEGINCQFADADEDIEADSTESSLAGAVNRPKVNSIQVKLQDVAEDLVAKSIRDELKEAGADLKTGGIQDQFADADQDFEDGLAEAAKEIRITVAQDELPEADKYLWVGSTKEPNEELKAETIENELPRDFQGKLIFADADKNLANRADEINEERSPVDSLIPDQLAESFYYVEDGPIKEYAEAEDYLKANAIQDRLAEGDELNFQAIRNQFPEAECDHDLIQDKIATASDNLHSEERAKDLIVGGQRQVGTDGLSESCDFLNGSITAVPINEALPSKSNHDEESSESFEASNRESIQENGLTTAHSNELRQRTRIRTILNVSLVKRSPTIIESVTDCLNTGALESTHQNNDAMPGCSERLQDCTDDISNSSLSTNNSIYESANYILQHDEILCSGAQPLEHSCNYDPNCNLDSISFEVETETEMEVKLVQDYSALPDYSALVNFEPHAGNSVISNIGKNIKTPTISGSATRNASGDSIGEPDELEPRISELFRKKFDPSVLRKCDEMWTDFVKDKSKDKRRSIPIAYREHFYLYRARLLRRELDKLKQTDEDRR